MSKGSAAALIKQEEYAQSLENDGIGIPDYLEKYYWWAYVRPWAVRIFERDWMINLILWGWYNPLRRIVQDMMGEKIAGRTLKISSTHSLAALMA